METRERNCGTQCEMWGVLFVCLFHNPILVSSAAPFELGLGIHNPRFVAGPFEVGLGSRNSRFVAWPLELGLGIRSPRFVAWPFELGLGIHNACSTMINRSTAFAVSIPTVDDHRSLAGEVRAPCLDEALQERGIIQI